MALFYLLLLFELPFVEVQEVPVLKDRSLETEAQNEVACRISDKDFRYVQVDQFGKPVDDITKTHEGSHMLHASISSPGYHGLYINGFGYKVKIPKTKISDLEIPEDDRGKGYKTYVINSQQWWDDDVIYFADEALAYLAGAKVRQQLGWDKRAETIAYGKEMTRYFEIALDKITKDEPDYNTIGMRSVLEHLRDSWKEIK